MIFEELKLAILGRSTDRTTWLEIEGPLDRDENVPAMDEWVVFKVRRRVEGRDEERRWRFNAEELCLLLEQRGCDEVADAIVAFSEQPDCGGDEPGRPANMCVSRTDAVP